MKVKELIEKLQKCNQEMDIILEHNIDVQDNEISCYLPWDILNGDLPKLGLRYDTVNSFKEKEFDSNEEHEVAYFEEGMIQSKVRL